MVQSIVEPSKSPEGLVNPPSSFQYQRFLSDDRPKTLRGQIERVVQLIKAEAREDFVVDARKIRVDSNGAICFGIGPIGMEARGLHALARRNRDVLPNAGPLLQRLDPHARSVLINHQLPKVRDRRLLLRTRVGPTGQRQLFAVLSPNYKVFDGDAVLERLGEGLPKDSIQGHAYYDAMSTTVGFDVLWEAERSKSPAVGDVFRWGLRIDTNDAGFGSIRGVPVVERLKCTNMAEFSMHTSREHFLCQRHRGNMDGIRGRIVEDARARLDQTASTFSAQWRALQEKKWKEFFRVVNVEEAYERIIRLVPRRLGPKATGRSQGSMIKILVEGFDSEPGESLADLVNGITAVHKLDVPRSIASRLEAAAGKVIHKLVEKAT